MKRSKPAVAISETAEEAMKKEIIAAGIQNQQVDKMMALLQLIRGENITCEMDEKVGPYISGLLDGKTNRPHPVGAKHKYLIFAVYAETTRLISRALAHFNIDHKVLGGTRKEKESCLQAFRGECDIMIITAARDCAGMHIPYATRTVIYHNIADKAILTQLGGRAQRVDRVYNLEFITILEEQEVGH